MSEKTRFHNMTKPMKFRHFKMIKEYIVLWCRSARERITYIYYYILNKLHILKRYSYRADWMEKILPDPTFRKTIHTKHYSADVVSRIREVEMSDIDYFYKEKNGHKEIVYVIKNEEEHKRFLIGHLENISLSVDGHSFYNVNSLPHFKVAIFEPEIKPYDENWAPAKPTFRTVTYNVEKLKGFRHQYILSDTNALIQNEVDYCFQCQVREFEQFLSKLPLKELEM